MGVMSNGFVQSLPEELMKLLHSLALEWGDVFDTSKLKVVHLSGAMTNKVYRISWPTKKAAQNDTRTVLVRIYGEGANIFFNRDDEVQTFECVAMHGHGPRLLGHFPQGRVEEFIDAKTLSASDLRVPEISHMIALKLREFHGLNMRGSKNALLWEIMRKWLTTARRLSSPEHSKEFHLDTIEEEIRILEKNLAHGNQEIGFCHNDLQYGNIMVDENTNSVTIIDYEYASYNPIPYDLANHFCEMAADYHSLTPHILDYSKYPDLEERKRFVQSYLCATGKVPSDTEVKKLVDDAEKYTLANHLFWGLWGIISGYVNHIDFDYMSYARQRFEQYWLRKPQLLEIKQDVTPSVMEGGLSE